MAIQKIDLERQSRDLTLVRSKLVADFLNGSDLNLTDGNNNATITGLAAGVNNNDAVNVGQLNNAIANRLSFKGVIDASDATGATLDGAIVGDFFRVSVAGTLDGIDFEPGDDLYITADITDFDLDGSGKINKIDNTESDDILRTTDIVDDLVTGGTQDVLSAEQGVVLKGLIDALQADKEVIEIDSLAAAPSLGLQEKLYVAKDTNKLYRWATTGGGSLDFDLTVGAGEAYETLEAAIAAAADGQNILVKAGTYSVASTINVNKKVKIVGEDKDTVIFETAGANDDPTSVFNVSVDDVALAKLSIKHKKTSNSSIETAIVASGGGWPQTRIKNFLLEDCYVEFVETGVAVRAEGWCVRDCTLAYGTGSASNSARAIIMYGTKGDSFIKSNVLKNDIIDTSSFRPLYLTSTNGTNPNETSEGKLVIEGMTQLGSLSQFFNQDNLQSAGAGTFELQIKNNTINESNLFAGFASYVQNAGNMFSSITLSGNSISNNHNATGGKGLYGVYGNTDFRSSALVVHADNNTLGQNVYRDGWETVEGTLVGKETGIPAFSVSLDSVIPASGDAPSVGGGSTSEYVEVSEQADLSQIESDISALQSTIAALGTEAWGEEPAVTNGSGVLPALSNIPVLAGTARVFLNGVRQRAGASNDYQINETTGVITFNDNLETGDFVQVDYKY